MASKNNFLEIFRYVVKFIEKLFKNLHTLLKGWWSSLNKRIDNLHIWRIRNNYHKSAEYAFVLIISLVYIVVFLPCLLIWALIKSI